MSSFNFYYLEKEVKDQDEKILDDDLFGFNKIAIKKISNDFGGFTLYSCTIEKNYKDTIYIYDNNEFKQVDSYKKKGKLDIFIKGVIAFVCGNYYDRLDFDRAVGRINELKEYLGKPKAMNVDLYKAVHEYEQLKSLSIKDFSATINKLKTSGHLSVKDSDISEFINRSDDITAATFVYPFNSEEYDIHIDTFCKIRLKNGDFDGALEDQLSVLENFYYDFIEKYKK